MWLTEKEAQKYLKVSRSTLLRLEETGKLPVYRVGGERLRRYRQEDLDAVMEPEIPKAAQGQLQQVLREPWQRLTGRARRAILRAHHRAVRSHAEAIQTEHLLVGLLQSGPTIAARALHNKGLAVTDLQSELEDQIRPGTSQKNRKEMGFSPDAQEALRWAYIEARELEDSQINTGHLLLGLLGVGQGLVYESMQARGIGPKEIRPLVEELSGTE